LGQTQTINFSPIQSQVVGAFPTNLTVAPNATSGLPVSLTSLSPAVCTASGVSVALLQTGQCILLATQAGNGTFGPAADVQVSFQVVQLQVMTFNPLTNRALGSPPFNVSASVNSGLPITFASGTPGVCSVSGNLVSLIAGGTCRIDASQVGSAVWAPIGPISQSFTVTGGAVGAGDGDVPLPVWVLLALGAVMLIGLKRRG
jgi:hypothetical protein